MQNLLIIDNDISYIQNILSNISKSIINIKLYNFYLFQDKEIFNEIISNNIDIIIFNIDMIKIDLVKFIYQNNIEFYEKSIIILYNDIKELKKILTPYYTKYIFKCIKKSSNANNLIKSLRTLTYIKENNYNEVIIEIKVKKILKKLGFNLNHSGTKYIIDAIKFLYINNVEEFKLKDIYFYLGKKYGKSENTIKGNIRRSIEYMYKNHDKNTLLDFFDYLELVDLPTPSEIIYTILEKM